MKVQPAFLIPHVDKLMNYIRYWQASGESIKTSIRTRTRIEQLTEEGHYTGGIVAFGYKRVQKGRLNKRTKLSAIWKSTRKKPPWCA